MSGKETTSNSFTDDGRLLQAEYAIKGVSEAGTIIGVVCSDGVILAGINPAEITTSEKIYQLNSGTYCCVAGIFSDAMRLIKFGRLASANIKEEIGAEPRLPVLCNVIGEEKQVYTQRAGSRPFGVSFLYSSFDDGEYCLYSTDPSGTVNKWKAWSFGVDEDAINGGLKNELPAEPLLLDEGIRHLFCVLSKARENPPGIAKRMEVLLYRRQGSEFLTADAIDKIISETALSVGK